MVTLDERSVFLIGYISFVGNVPNKNHIQLLGHHMQTNIIKIVTKLKIERQLPHKMKHKNSYRSEMRNEPLMLMPVPQT